MELKEKNSLMETGEDIPVRRSKGPAGNRPQLRKRLSREISVTSNSSTTSFHSCNSDVSDDATLADWKGWDLSQTKSIPDIDILLLAVRKDNVAELSNVLDRHSGILGYISKFWRGFFPLLMIELENHEQSFNEDSNESVEYAKKIQYL